MKVFKFGGASVKDADAVRNVVSILQRFDDKIAVVVSAMGKTTNAMELIVNSLWNRDEESFNKQVEERRTFHLAIIDELFQESSSITTEINCEFDNLLNKYNERVPENFDFEYDQIVSLGEVISTKIIAAFLNHSGVSAKWKDAREIIRTDRIYREAEIDWNRTKQLFETEFIPEFENTDVCVLQGFIGHTAEGFTTTLGREGSDFTAGIIAFCCDAQDVTIWKDVPGMLNADPKFFDNTIKLDQISFKEAIELSYYGASVIHPKTVKPLQNKGIPLYVKSFVHPEAEGTVIQSNTSKDHLVPSFIFKLNQCLFSITPKDFSFIIEKNLSDIFQRVAQLGVKINVMQNSALDFSFLLDGNKIDIQQIVDAFNDTYNIRYNDGLELITIRHFDQETIDRTTENKEILLEQKTRETVRIIARPHSN